MHDDPRFQFVLRLGQSLVELVAPLNASDNADAFVIDISA